MDEDKKLHEILQQDIWKNYGFEENPFDTRALSLWPREPLSVAQALVGRDLSCPESRLLTNLLRTPGGGRIVVEGEIGVGKTTFVNYHRYLWEYKAKDKLFSPYREISVMAHWNIKDLLINILVTLVSKLTAVHPKAFKNHQILQEILALSKVFFTHSFQAQGNLFWIGGGYGSGAEANIPQPSEALLIYYFEHIVNTIKSLGYAGVILHFDDMELISKRTPELIRNLFEDVRNVLQAPDVYFIFIGHSGFFHEIIGPLERVRSIFFGYPILLNPLSKEQTIEAIERRYTLLAKKKGTFIRPVENSFIERLYDLYRGKTRFLMDAMALIVPAAGEVKTLTRKEAHGILRRLVKEKIHRMVTDQEFLLIEKGAIQKKFTNQDMSKLLGISPSQVSQLLSRLQELNFVYLHEKKGRQKYYRVDDELAILEDEKTGPVKKKKSGSSSPDLPIMAKSLKTKERLALAEDLLKKKGSLSLGEYQRLLAVSLPTASRDLKSLEAQSKARCIQEGRRKLYYTV